MTAAPRPGWYPDPAGAADLYRWWDGDAWTDAISESAQAPRPGAVPPVASPSRGVTRAEPEPDGTVSHPEMATHLVERTPRSRLRAVVLLVGAFAIFVAAALGVGLMIWREPGSAGAPPLSSGGASSPGSGSATAVGPQAPPGQLDESTGVATIGQASITLPGPPYKLEDDPLQITGVFDAFFVANAGVHLDYDRSRDWSATVGLAHFSPTLTHSEDLSQAGVEAMAQLSRHFFGGQPTKVSTVTSSDRAVDGHSGVLLTAQVHYEIADLPSRYDTVTAWLVRLDDGSLVAALSSVPNDASAEVTRLAQQSVESLTIS